MATYSDEAVCATSTKDVWYIFTPSETREYTFRRRYLNGGAPTGITVYNGTPGNTRLNISQLKVGIYFLRIHSQASVNTIKVIKK